MAETQKSHDRLAEAAIVLVFDRQGKHVKTASVMLVVIDWALLAVVIMAGRRVGSVVLAAAFDWIVGANCDAAAINRKPTEL